MKEHVSLKERYDIQCDHLVKTCDVFRREVYALNCRPSRAELDNSISMYNREVRDHRKTSDALQAAKDRLIDATPLITENVHSSSN